MNAFDLSVGNASHQHSGQAIVVKPSSAWNLLVCLLAHIPTPWQEVKVHLSGTACLMFLCLLFQGAYIYTWQEVKVHLSGTAC